MHIEDQIIIRCYPTLLLLNQLFGKPQKVFY